MNKYDDKQQAPDALTIAIDDVKAKLAATHERIKHLEAELAKLTASK